MWVENCYKKGKHIDSRMIWEKDDNSKQNEGEGSKAGEVNASKGWFDISEGCLAKNVKSLSLEGQR